MKTCTTTLLDLDKALALPTPRLLAYYKKYGHTWQGRFSCECCGEYVWHLYDDAQDLKKEHRELSGYFASLKAELDKRGHVPKKIKKVQPRRKLSKQAMERRRKKYQGMFAR